LLATVSHEPLTSFMRLMTAPEFAPGAAAISRSVTLPATRRSRTGEAPVTVTVTGALRVPDGSARRKVVLVVRRGLSSLTRPRAPVTPLAASRQSGDTAVRSSSLILTPDAG
jgi:hypothetical protein